VPARLLSNRHLQTIWGGVLRRRAEVPVTRERWELPDGEHLQVHILPEQPRRPGVLVLHGLEGSANARYVRGVLARVQAAGWNGAAFDFRSCGAPEAEDPGGGTLGRGLYHAGKTDDLGFAVARLRARWGDVPFGVVGFSLGGNLLIKWLGEAGAASPANAAVAISVPFDLAACAAAIDAPGFWSRIYRERFLRSLRRKALRYAATYPDGLDPATIAACRTFAAYDDSVVARIFGFANAADYWARCSARRFLPDVQRPTLLVAGTDDPFVPPEVIPHEAIAENPRLTLALCEGGGHVGFIAGSPWRPRYAAEDLTIEFLERHFG
jgi:predicted alpha/beta-fold hydrolase